MMQPTDTVESVVREQIDEAEGLVFDSVETKSNGLLHIVAGYPVPGEEADAEEVQSAYATLLGTFEGVVRKKPLLYERAALDFNIEDAGRVRFEVPTLWVRAYHADQIGLEELYDRVWGTVHYVDIDGTPHSKADVLDELPDDVDLD